jgi:chlorobactene glucosyltransferase
MLTLSIAIISLALVSLLAINLCLSLRVLQPLHTFNPVDRKAKDWPLVSVLIPARNESTAIGNCLKSLLLQDYPNIEILVWNDESSDMTAEVVGQMAMLDPRNRIQLLQGTLLPSDWMGKAHACWQLSERAQGEYLLFTDANTIHGRASVANTVAAMEKLQVGMLSVLPRQRAKRWCERLLIPILPLSILMFLPIGFSWQRPGPKFSARVGQFLAFRRAAYLASGGHSAIKNSVLDDVELTRRTKKSGWNVALLDGGQAVQCQMYNSFPAIWQGFSKSLFSFYNHSVPLTVIVELIRIFAFVIPPVFAFLAWYYHWAGLIFLLSSTAYFVGVGMRCLISWRLGAQGTILATNWLFAIFHPIAEIFYGILLINSLRFGLSGVVKWKGRVYSRVR